MAADYDALEARVAELEQQLRHILPAKIDAVSYGLGRLHGKVQDFRGEMTEFRGETRIELERHRDLLEEILRRLPADPSA
jgi:hypothetical protein